MQSRTRQKDCQKNRREALKARRDNRGYTLQTIIVMSILIAAAVGASVVLLRAVSSNTDARSLTDTAGTNAPSRPHSFVVEKTLATVGSRTVPSATVRWSPPLFTGFTRLEEQPVDASSASLLYEVEYGCADPADSTEISELADIALDNIPDDPTNDPMDNSVTAETDESKLDIDGLQTMYGDSTQLSLPSRILGELFPSSMPPETVYCILRATAYTCPNAPTQPCANPGDNESRTNNALTGSEIYSLESELIRFELSRAPTEILNLEYVVPPEGMTATNNLVDLAWNTPEYTGARVAHLYEIKWAQRGDGDVETDFDTATIPASRKRCTVGNTYSLDLNLDADDPPNSVNELIADIRITPYATTKGAADAAVPPNFPCPSSDDLIAGTPIDLHGIELVENGPIPDDLRPTLAITVPPSSESVPAADAAKRTYLQNHFVNLQAEITLVVPKTRSYNLDNYELQWSRADGTGTPHSRMITATDPTDYTPSSPPIPPPQERYSSSVILNLENNRAYNFTLTANFRNGETRTTNNCAVISHPERTPAPELEVVPATESLRVRISPQNQASFCNSPIISTPSPSSTQHYKVRVYSPSSVCQSPGDYPNKRCTNDDYSQCIAPNGSAAKEIIVPGLAAGTVYEVEVIAGHTCNTTMGTIDFTIPSSNPSNYGYPSAPVAKRAIPDADVPDPSTLTSLTIQYELASNSWKLGWTFLETSKTIGFMVTAQHRELFNSMESSIIIAFPLTSRSPEASSYEVSCSEAGNNTNCEVLIPDDENPLPPDPDPYTSFNAVVQTVTTEGISPLIGSTRIEECGFDRSQNPVAFSGCTFNLVLS